MTGLLGVASLLELAARRHGFGGSGFQHAALSARLCEQAMTTLLIAHPTLWGESSSAPPVQSRRAVHRALEYLESTRGARTTPTELAAAVGVSLRTLELGFRHELDTTPQAHVTDLRLRRAHAELVSSTEEHGATVRAIAARWGFSNAGRFAQQYLAAYGERPSETLRRR
ncbi:MAG: helix-turn-helix domain-containing protein [Pseudoclavibacter sp.]